MGVLEAHALDAPAGAAEMSERVFSVIWGGICVSAIFVSLAGAVHANHHRGHELIGAEVFSFHFEPRPPEGWWNPGYTHTMDRALPELWRLGERWYPIRDLMGRPI